VLSQPNVTDMTKRRLRETTQAIHQNPSKKREQQQHKKGEDIKIRIQPRYASNRDLYCVTSEMQRRPSCQYRDRKQHSAIKTGSLRNRPKANNEFRVPRLELLAWRATLIETSADWGRNEIQ